MSWTCCGLLSELVNVECMKTDMLHEQNLSAPMLGIRAEHEAPCERYQRNLLGEYKGVSSEDKDGDWGALAHHVK